MPARSDTAGILYVVATPLGEPADITGRALETLREADLVAAEDTRAARRLLQSHGIDRPLVSYHDWNEAERARALVDRVAAGARVAVVSEAGTPGLSDPGFDVVRLARREGHRVSPVPGPCALTAFLSVSGLPTNAFTFLGFPPPRSSARRKFFAALTERSETLVFYESPRRTVSALRDALELFGDRETCLAREMTKRHEEFLFGPLGGILAALEARPKVLGEVCWGIRGAEGAAARAADPVARPEAPEAARPREAARALARQLGIPVKEAYRRLLPDRAAGPRGKG
jgi:16S rRNA (cytidine1402-2'-O)-methyltransferase